MIQKKLTYFLISALLFNFFYSIAYSQYPPGTITKEKDVPPYGLTDPLEFSNGKTVYTVPEWETERRPYLYDLFVKNI